MIRYFVVSVVGAAWILTILVRKEIRSPDRLHILVALFFGWAGLSILWSSNVAQTTNLLPSFLLNIVICIFIWDSFRTERQLKKGLRSIVFAGFVWTIFVIREFFLGIQYSPGRYSALGINPNKVATIIVIGIPIAWYLSIIRFPDNKYKIIGRSILYITLSLSAILLTGSRQAIVAGIPAFLFILWSISKRYKFLTPRVYLPVFILVIVLTSILLPDFILQRIQTIPTEIQTGDIGSRTTQWTAGWKLFTQNPFLGVGSGSFMTSVEPLIGYEVGPDNTFFTILYELGMVGIILFTVIVGRILGILTYFKREKLLFWISLLLMWIALWIVNDWMKRPHLWIVFGLLMAHAVASHNS